MRATVLYLVVCFAIILCTVHISPSAADEVRPRLSQTAGSKPDGGDGGGQSGGGDGNGTGSDGGNKGGDGTDGGKKGGDDGGKKGDGTDDGKKTDDDKPDDDKDKGTAGYSATTVFLGIIFGMALMYGIIEVYRFWIQQKKEEGETTYRAY